MSKIDPFAAVLTFIIENSFPRCMNVEVQLPGACVFWLFLCSISSTFTTSRAHISVLLSNACVREIFGDSCSICESRTHMTSKNRWFLWFSVNLVKILVLQCLLLFRSIKGAAHGIHFGHIPVGILRFRAVVHVTTHQKSLKTIKNHAKTMKNTTKP